MRRPPSINRITWFLISSVFVIISLTTSVFVFFFHDNKVGVPADFSTFATYFNGIATPILAFLSSLMIVFTIWYQAFQSHTQALKAERSEAKENLETYQSQFENKMRETLFIHGTKPSTSQKVSLANLMDPVYLLEHESHIGYLSKCSELRQSPPLAPDDFDKYAINQLADIVGALELACIAFGHYMETSPSEVESRVYYEKLYRLFNDFKTAKLLYPDQIKNLQSLIDHSLCQKVITK